MKPEPARREAAATGECATGEASGQEHGHPLDAGNDGDRRPLPIVADVTQM